MEYSKGLIESVKVFYKDFPAIIEMAESCNSFLGRYLDDGSVSKVEFNEVLDATNLATLKVQIEYIKQKRELYYDWCKEFDTFHNYQMGSNTI